MLGEIASRIGSSFSDQVPVVRMKVVSPFTYELVVLVDPEVYRTRKRELLEIFIGLEQEFISKWLQFTIYLIERHSTPHSTSLDTNYFLSHLMISVKILSIVVRISSYPNMKTQGNTKN